MSTTPPTDPTPEYLEQDGGTAAAPERGRGGRRRTAVLGVGGVAAAALVGAGAWAATTFLATGDQPAEALPAGTLGYLSVDLDPSGSQKLAALRTLEKFPAFADAVDVGSSDDVASDLGEALLTESGCEVDYAADVEPWLGSRFALAAVVADGSPAPVAVLQVEDAAAAERGLAALAACDDGDAGWAVEGDWAVLAESDAVAARVLADAGDSSLADDADFARWTSEAGDPGVLTGYAAPGAGTYLAEAFGDAQGTDLPPRTALALERFDGAAMTARFADGGLEVEMATDTAGGRTWTAEGDQGGAAVSALPSDTAAALGIGFEPGWVGGLLDALRESPDLGPDLDGGLAQLEQLTGLQVPEDVETLFGDSAALSLGGDLDLNALAAGPGGSGVPVALSVQGDPAEVERVLETLRRAAGPGAAGVLASRSEGDTVVVGPDAAYRADVLGSGGLGDSDTFTDVVPDAERASAVLYVDVDAFDTLVAQASAGDPEAAQNLEPLAAIGAAGWVDGDVSHARLRITTDD